MTVVKYLMASGVCNSTELLTLKREHPADYDTLVKMAEEEMQHNGIVVEKPAAKE